MNSPTAPRLALRWWPCVVGGLLWPVVSIGLGAWFPPHVATAVAFAVLWGVVGLIFLRFPPTASWRFGRWMLGGAAGAIVCGTITYFLPWF